MNLLIVVFAALSISSTSMAGDTGVIDENVRLEEALGFIGKVAAYQGQFDSVVNFCRPHAPGVILRHSISVWHKEYDRVLELKDSEVRRIAELARTRGASQEKVDDFIAAQEKIYKRALNDDRLYKDLKAKADLSTACSSRLGVMLSESMSLSRAAPDAWAYFKSVHDQKVSE